MADQSSSGDQSSRPTPPPGFTLSSPSGSAAPSATPEKVYYNDAGQPFTASGRPPPQPAQPAQDTGYTGAFLPFRTDASGFHLAWPEAIAAPIRGMVKGGERLLGVGEADKDPLRPLDRETTLAVGSLVGTGIRAPGGTLGPTTLAPGGRFTEPPLPPPGPRDVDIGAFTRAVKPTVAGKATRTQLENYRNQVRSAVDSVIQNMPNLHFADEKGNVTTGRLPRSLEEFGDAIEQTREAIFKQYDALQRLAGGQVENVTPASGTNLIPPGTSWQEGGSKVPLHDVASELSKIWNDPVVQDLHPDLAGYAQARARAFLTRGSYSTEEAQRAIQNLNASLKAFYRNPSYETASRASVDAMVANQLRSKLDDVITKAVGPGYQELKNRYGALKAIEKEVNNRASVVARQEKGGGLFGRIAGVASAEEVLRGFLTLDPVALARGAAMKGFAEIVKMRRDPNRVIAKLFERADQSQPSTPSTSMAYSWGPPVAVMTAPSAAGDLRSYLDSTLPIP